LRDVPDLVEDHFVNAGRGAILGMCPYDLAAALLIAQEAGCIVTDAYGNTLDDVLLLDTSVSNQHSLVAAANKELHGKLMTFFDTRIRQFGHVLKTQRGS
jgi:myo-inositol-1(or 4)-monophosphatase